MHESACRRLEELPWRPHPTAKGVEMKALITKGEHGPDVSCLLIRVPVGASVPVHTHETQEDLVFPMSGKASMRVGEEEFDLTPGVFVRVPPNTPHGILRVDEELIVYDVFSPALI